MQITFTTSDFNHYNISCFGAKDGSITVNVSGGTPPYTYQWSNEQTTATITGLSADFHNVVVTDSTGESAEYGINLTSPEFLKPILTAYQYNNGYNISLYGASNGSITTTIDGGVSPFTFQWEDGPSTQNRSQLGGGFYSLVVTDANNCLANVQTTLSEPERDDWTMGGNANTNPSNHFIGTTDSSDLVLKTNGQERMRMLGNGNMRVHALADSGQGIISVDADGNLFRSNIYIGHLSAQGNTPEIFSYGKAPDPGTLGTICNPTSLYSPVTHQFLGMMESYNISSQNGLYNVLRFGSDSQHGIIDADGFIGYGQSAGQNSALLLNYYCGNHVVVGNGTSGNLGVGISPSYRLHVSGNAKISGNVGIGVAPDAGNTYKLQVCGSIRAKEVVVEEANNWCDFVFEEGHERMSFDEKEKYLKSNKHLPYISPGTEIIKNGLPLKQTLTGLTQNVEEMSLDMIELYKAVQALKKENEDLKSEITSLKRR